MKAWRVYTWSPTGTAVAETVVAEGVDFSGGALVFYRALEADKVGRELIIAFSPSRWTEVIPVA